MRTVAALSLCALLGTIPASASSVPPGGPGQAAPAAVTPERLFEAGTVVRGEVIERTFPVRNGGDAMLRITNLESSCNCAAGHYTNTIEPGREGYVSIRIETEDFSGPIEKSIVAHTNDPQAPAIRFTVTATVDDVILVIPGRKASLGDIPREEGTIRKFGLRSADDTLLRITGVEVAEGYAEFEVESLEEGKVAVLAVIIPPHFEARNGSDVVHAKFAVHTSHPRMPLLYLTARGELRDRLSRAPREVRFGTVGRKVLEGGDPDAPALWRDLSIVYIGSVPLSVESVQAFPDYLAAELLEDPDSPQPVIRLRVRLGAPSGPLKGWVKAKTNLGSLLWPVSGSIK